MMSKTNYVAIANIIAAERSLTTPGTKEWVRLRGLTFSFADYFRRDNPRFNRDTFYRECGFENR